MKITEYFTKHPVAAIVLNCMILLIGMMCLKSLKIMEYPKIETSVITVVTRYPNASPELVESSVTNVLEERLAGVEGLESIRSWSSDNSSEICLNFKPGQNIEKAVSSARDAISLARDNLPIGVREPSILKTGRQKGGVSFMFVSIESDRSSFAELTHYANINVKNAIRSVNGVSSVEVYGPTYTYDVKLDPLKLHAFGINVDEVFTAIGRDNMSYPVGKFRDVIPTSLDSKLKELADFENIIIKYKNFADRKHKQHAVFLKDVANIKLATTDKMRIHINGKAGVCLAIEIAADANPLDTSNGIRAEIEKLQKSALSGIKIYVTTDQAEFIRSSLSNIYSATFEAIFLVLVIVFLFLRNMKATIIPLVTIPISLIGAILFLKVFGFSINVTTLLAMVLAVGLVVDDAIVVLENIARHRKMGKPALQAAIDGSSEIGFAVIAMTLTLVSVYAPFAFVEGAIGRLFIEFAVALSGSVLLSGVAALTLSPLMCSVILNRDSRNLFPKIDEFLNNTTFKYSTILEKIIKHKKIPLAIVIASLIATITFLKILPNEIAPKEDRGLIGVFMPPVLGKDINHYDSQLAKVEKVIGNIQEARDYLGIVSDWGGTIVLPLKSKKERKLSASEIITALYPKVVMFPSQDVYPWSWDSNLPGLNDEISFSAIEVVISTTEDYKDLYKNLENVKKELDKEPAFFKNHKHDLNINTMAYKIDVNSDAASRLHLTNQQIAKTIEIFFSDNTFLNFQKDGILYPITIEGEKKPWTLSELYVTNPFGKRISLSTVAKMRKVAEPHELFHYGQMKSATIGVDIANGQNISTVYKKLLDKLNSSLPKHYKKTAIGNVKSLEQSSNTMAILFVLAVIFIFAILSVQFNNFIDPLLVLITVPLACSGALLTIWLFGISLNIYTQVGLITLVGLITKHGILIVEFVNQQIENGMSIMDSVRRAASLRMRPILMTTGAMIFGSIPLIVSNSYGHEARECIGYIIVGGLTFGTIFTLFVLPVVCYYVKAYRTKER